MSDILLCYTVEDTGKANVLTDRLKKETGAADVEGYPIIGNNLWDGLSDGSIRNKLILLISTPEMLEKYSDEIKRHIYLSTVSNNSFAFIVFDKQTEMLLMLNIRNYPEAKSSLDILREQQVPAYISAAQLQKKRGKSNWTLNRVAFLLALVALVCLLCIVVLLAVFLQNGYLHNDIVKIICFILVGIVLLTGVPATGFFWFDTISRLRKNARHAEKRDFAINLEQSLTKSNVSLDEENIRILERRIRKDAEFGERDGEERGGAVSAREDVLPKIADDSGYQPLGHLIMNWDQMKGYYDISKAQAKTAFRWAIFFCFIGIMIILLAVLSPVIPLYANSQTPLVPIIGAIGGAVTELFAGTILVVYSKSLSQMNLYHEALSEYQSYLSRVNLVSKLSTVEKRDAMYEKIIESELLRSPSASDKPES